MTVVGDCIISRGFWRGAFLGEQVSVKQVREEHGLNHGEMLLRELIVEADHMQRREDRS
ncbi:hypothetical protein AG1IA_04600 [Rhizoctonia solani AG-1 IA]|uniref:Uncharacterized protein n=1 Tax=Thanatephorus cucumeris (strain AG1-IA) TaxID=983506 RepID=L8WX26_THACA|nr:hypothetical protein AG1IA_04600 [Rhizoctonia solani AG-1 IA]